MIIKMKNISNNVKIALIIGVVVLIMFFSYFVYFSPLAQCVDSLKKNTKISNHDAKLVCMERMGIKSNF